MRLADRECIACGADDLDNPFRPERRALMTLPHTVPTRSAEGPIAGCPPRPSRFGGALRAVAWGLIALPSCYLLPGSVGGEDGWSVEYLPAEVPAGAVANPVVAERASDPDWFLYLASSSAKLDYGSTDGFFDSLYKQPFENGKGVGHCWIVLEGAQGRRAFGHSGEYGKERPTYNEGVRDLISAGDPNPARYLWEEMHDGHVLRGPGARPATYCCRVPITREVHDRILRFAEEFDYSVFALHGKGCSDFVVAAARLADLYVSNQIRLSLPRRISILGDPVTLWSDRRYSTIVFGSPEQLEEGLRELVRRGAAIKTRYPF